MKHLLPITLLLLTSCAQYYMPTQQVTFNIQGISEEFSTRATLPEANITDLFIWEGNTLLAHKQSTDNDLTNPSLNLTYGSHTLTFLASNSDNQSWANGIWSTTHVINDYATILPITVNGTGNTQSVELSRRSSRVKFLTTDRVPSNVTQCRLSVHNYLSLNSTLTASNDYTHNPTVDITNKQGNTYSVFVNTLTLSPTDEEQCDVKIEFLNANNTVLYQYARTITLKPNRCVTLKGAYFSGLTNNITITTTAYEDVEQSLFP